MGARSRGPASELAGGRWALSGLVAALLVTGCSFSPARPAEYLDEKTAATVTSVSSPIVFARAHQDVSSNSRQYVTVAAVSVDRSGRYEYLLLVYPWSTVDSRLGIDVHPAQNLLLLADDRAIRLVRDKRTPQEAGVSEPLHAPQHTRHVPRVYRTNEEELRFVSRARRLRLQLEGDEDPRPFEIWEDGREALQRFTAGDH